MNPHPPYPGPPSSALLHLNNQRHKDVAQHDSDRDEAEYLHLTVAPPHMPSERHCSAGEAGRLRPERVRLVLEHLRDIAEIFAAKFTEISAEIAPRGSHASPSAPRWTPALGPSPRRPGPSHVSLCPPLTRPRTRSTPARSGIRRINRERMWPWRLCRLSDVRAAISRPYLGEYLDVPRPVASWRPC